MKKILAMLLVFVMVFALVACSGKKNATTTTGANSNNGATPEKPAEITLTVWAPQEDQSAENPWLKTMADKFAAAHPEFKITWKFGVCSEADAKANVVKDPKAAANVFLYANDQLEELLNNNALAAMPEGVLADVKKECSEGALLSVTGSDGKVYGVPYQANTWFMYYNKDVFDAEDIKSLEKMLEKAPVAFPLNNGWYLPAFYFANGCTVYGATGTNSADGFKMAGEAGTAVTKYLLDLVANPNFRNDANGSGHNDFKNGEVAAYFSGDWDLVANTEALGDKVGCAVLPTITIDGQQKQLKAFNGSKAVGVNAYSDSVEQLKAAYMFAAFIGGAEGQKARFEARGTIPCANSLESLRTSEAAKAVVAVVNGASCTQPSLPQSFWSACTALADEILNPETRFSKDEAAAKAEAFNKALAGEATT